jgi:hypothetical protein
MDDMMMYIMDELCISHSLTLSLSPPPRLCFKVMKVYDIHSKAVSVYLDTFPHALTHDTHEITRQANQARREENQRPLKIGSADVVEAAPMVA